MEIASIIASVISIAVGIFVIWLSLTFYKMSSRILENVSDASRSLQTSVDRLEAILNRLYTGTFSVTKESVSEMHKYARPEVAPQEDLLREEIEKKAEKKAEDIRKALEREISAVSEKQSILETKIESVKKQMPGLQDRAITEPKKGEVEPFKGSIRERIEKQIISYKHRGYKGIISEFLIDGILSETPQLTGPAVESELNRMKEEGIVDWEGDQLGPHSHIEFKK